MSLFLFVFSTAVKMALENRLCSSVLFLSPKSVVIITISLFLPLETNHTLLCWWRKLYEELNMMKQNCAHLRICQVAILKGGGKNLSPVLGRHL